MKRHLRHTRPLRVFPRLLLPAALLLVGAVTPVAAQGGRVTVSQDTVQVRQQNLSRLFSTGMQYIQIGAFADAIPALRRYTELDSTNVEVWSFLAICYIQTNQLPMARDAYRALLRIEPKQREALEGLGWVYHEMGEREALVEVYEYLVESYPDDPDYRTLLEDLYRRGDDRQALIRFLEREAERHPDDPEIRRRLSDLYRREGETESRIQALEEALRRNPTNAELLEQLGRIYTEEVPRPGEAVRIFTLLTEARPQDALSWRRLARVLLETDQTEQAATAYRRAIQLDPREVRTYSELARVSLERKAYDEAEALVRQALQIKPDDGYALVTWGDILWSRGFAQADSQGIVPYEAKIVLEEAIEKYRAAADQLQVAPDLRTYALRRAEELEPYRRTPAEIFMHRGRPPPAPIPPVAQLALASLTSRPGLTP